MLGKVTVHVHCLFRLPIEHEGKQLHTGHYQKKHVIAMSTNLHSLKLVIIDKVSMSSSLNLTYIHLRLQELLGDTRWFGSKNVLFVLEQAVGPGVLQTFSTCAVKQ